MTGTPSRQAVDTSGESSGLPLVAGDQRAVDQFRGDTLVVFCWSDVRPLRGVAGFVDWRLGGAISHALEEGDFAADPGEVMLMPVAGRMGPRRVFVFGLGATADRHETLEEICRQAFDVLAEARVERVTFVAPRTFEDDETEAAFVRALAQAREGRELLVESVLVERV